LTVSAAYPNPAYESTTAVQVDLLSSCPIRAEWKVVTTAYRVMAKGSLEVSGAGRVVWDLRDQKGRRVSNGLYTLVIETAGGESRRIPLMILR
jgi:hypothetical protein